MAEIEAIVSDFGGVLTTPLLSSFMAVQDEIGISPENLGKAMRTITEEDGENPLFALERGEMTEADFLERLGDGLEPLLGHRPELHRFREIYFEALHPNEPMIELMRELKASGQADGDADQQRARVGAAVALDAAGRRDLRDRRRLRLRRLPQAGSADLRDDPGAARPARPRPASSSTTSSPTSRAPARLGMQRGPLPATTSRRSPRSAVTSAIALAKRQRRAYGPVKLPA